VITREESGDLAILRLAHGKVSALDVDLCTAIVDGLRELEGGSARAVIVTGTGAAFSAGVDLFKVLDGGREYLARFLPAMESLFKALLLFPRPLVAAINGHAIAGGCIAAAACDHRVMADGSARIGIPELAVGVPFPMLPFEIVRARVSRQHFRHLVMTGRTVTPPDALALGLIEEIAPLDVLITRATHAAEQLLRIPAVSFALTKRTFAAAVLERANRSAALNAEVLEAWAHDDVQARIRTYLEQTVGKK
jgi:enoyl-CoA hydratase